jgi:hypothetical protein
MALLTGILAISIMRILRGTSFVQSVEQESLLPGFAITIGFKRCSKADSGTDARRIN